MKKILFLLLLFFYSINAFSQNSDTTQYLFKNLKYSYLQYTFGYERIAFGPHDVMNGVSATLFGAVFGDKLAIGADLDVANKEKRTFVAGETYPQTAMYMGMSLTIEPLIRPKKLINFSIPIKFGIGNAMRWDTAMDFNSQWTASFASSALNYQVNEYSDNFFVGSLGVNAFVNLWKPLSLGAGMSYRYSIPMHTTHHADDYAGTSIFIVLRWKIDTKAFYQKTLERQKEYMQKVQGQ